jgi:predicted protein tyrosine phosphatase
MATKTVKIFSSECPYDNKFQTNTKRLLFVCSVGMLRSPTAQMVATGMGFNARACGSDVDLALIPLSCNLINWADHIIFMNDDNLSQAVKTFESVGYKEDIEQKAIVWNIKDDYDWGDSVLWNIVHEKLKLI